MRLPDDTQQLVKVTICSKDSLVTVGDLRLRVKPLSLADAVTECRFEYVSLVLGFDAYTTFCLAIWNCNSDLQFSAFDGVIFYCTCMIVVCFLGIIDRLIKGLLSWGQ